MSTPTDPARQAELAYRLWIRAVLERDLDALARLSAPELYGTRPSGQAWTREGLFAHLRAGLAPPVAGWIVGAPEVRLYDEDTAILTTKDEIALTAEASAAIVRPVTAMLARIDGRWCLSAIKLGGAPLLTATCPELTRRAS